MITDRDVKKLKESFKDTFATKDDLKAMEKRQDQKYATKNDLKSELEPIKKDLSEVKKGIRSVRKDIASLRTVTDEVAKKHHQRIERIETHLGLSHLVD